MSLNPETFLNEKTNKQDYEKAQRLALEATNLIKEANKKIKELYSIGLEPADIAADEIMQFELYHHEDNIEALHQSYDEIYDYVLDEITDAYAVEVEEILEEFPDLTDPDIREVEKEKKRPVHTKEQPKNKTTDEGKLALTINTQSNYFKPLYEASKNDSEDANNLINREVIRV